MISKEIDIPIMVYNNPATSNIDITPEFLLNCQKLKMLNTVKSPRWM